jgi:von Willebrand factor type A domain/Aerotolerance regulator N-terminal
VSGLGIANPLGAAGLAAVAVLLWLHRRRLRRRRVPVSTLLLWRRVPPAPPVRRRPRFDALLFVRLALVLALVGGLLGPFLGAPGVPGASAPLLVVLDVSASMQARERGGTRFALARRRARALVEGSDETMLVLAAERPRVAVRWTADRRRVLERLETVEPLDVPGDLEPSLALARAETSGRSGARIAVLTDVPRPAAAPATMRWVEVGRTDDNVAVAGLTVDDPPGGHPALTAVVRNHSGTARRVAVEASAGGRRWARRTLDLAPHAVRTLTLRDPPAAGEVEVGVEPGDALAVDDVARAWLAPRPPLDLLVVGDRPEGAAALAAVARALPGMRVRSLPTGAWTGTAAGAIVVFDRTAPAPPTDAPALYAAPPADNAVCPAADVAGAAAVVDWDETHPALAGLGPQDALVAVHVQAIAPPSWGMPVLIAAGMRGVFPLLVAGERDGRRIACLGADLDRALLGSDGLPLLLATLGTLRWLAARDEALVARTGIPFAVPDAGDAPPPDGVRLAGGVAVAERAGRFRLGPPGAERVVLASLADDRESDIGRDGAREWAPVAPPPEPAPAPGRRDVGWWVLAAAGALMLSEWLLWRRSAW